MALGVGWRKRSGGLWIFSGAASAGDQSLQDRLVDIEIPPIEAIGELTKAIAAPLEAGRGT